VSGNRFYGFHLVNIAERRRFCSELEPFKGVDLARSKVVKLNDAVGRNRDIQKMAENVLGLNGEYAILRLLVEYFL